MSGRSHRDEEEQELQRILDEAPERPEPPTIECFFCENMADQWVEPEEIGLDVSDGVEKDDLIAICSYCYGLEVDCFECSVGIWCEFHNGNLPFEIQDFEDDD